MQKQLTSAQGLGQLRGMRTAKMVPEAEPIIRSFNTYRPTHSVFRSRNWFSLYLWCGIRLCCLLNVKLYISLRTGNNNSVLCPKSFILSWLYDFHLLRFF